MIIEPKTRGFICTTAHPDGCRQAVQNQITYVKEQPAISGAKRVLVLGASTGYGLASRICAAFGMKAATIGVIFDKPAAGSRTASAGWYNTAAFEALAAQDGLYAKTINGDAYSTEIKEKTIALIQQDLKTVDLVVYSLAAPRRTMPDGTVVSSVLKTTGKPYTNKTIDLKTEAVTDITIEPATREEINNTVKVMGGEDWMDWIQTLHSAGVLAENAVTVAYSYIGPALTHPIYKDGSIGRAKDHLFETSQKIAQSFSGIRSYISVNKALVTQSSAAIPVVPLYISILYKVMKEQGLHEGCIEQMYRMFSDKLYTDNVQTDAEGRLRLDDWEMRPNVQAEVLKAWEKISTENVKQYADIAGYWEDFYQMFGFMFPEVAYDKDTNPAVPILSIDE